MKYQRTEAAMRTVQISILSFCITKCRNRTLALNIREFVLVGDRNDTATNGGAEEDGTVPASQLCQDQKQYRVTDRQTIRVQSDSKLLTDASRGAEVAPSWHPVISAEKLLYCHTLPA
jgi:hypothetical protein